MAKRPPVVAIRLDGCLALYDKNRGSLEIGRPLDGAREFCRWIMEDLQCHLIVVTGRRREDLVKAWLAANAIPYSTVNSSIADSSVRDSSHQVIADIYIEPQHRSVGMVMGRFDTAAREVGQRVFAINRDRESYDW